MRNGYPNLSFQLRSLLVAFSQNSWSPIFHSPLVSDHSRVTGVFPPVADKPGGELRPVCASLDGLASVGPERLRLWLGKLVVSLGDRGDESSARGNERLESQQLLQSLTAYLVREDRSVRGQGGQVSQVKSHVCL